MLYYVFVCFPFRLCYFSSFFCLHAPRVAFRVEFFTTLQHTEKKARDFPAENGAGECCALHDGWGETKPMEKFTRLSLRRDFRGLPVRWGLVAIVGIFRDEKLGKLRMKSRRFRLRYAPAISLLFVISIFQRGTTKVRPRPKSRNEMTANCLHNPHHFQFERWNCEELCEARRSRLTSKTLSLVDVVTNSKIYFHLLPTKTRFLPAFRCASLVKPSRCASRLFAVEIVE